MILTALRFPRKQSAVNFEKERPSLQLSIKVATRFTVENTSEGNRGQVHD